MCLLDTVSSFDLHKPCVEMNSAIANCVLWSLGASVFLSIMDVAVIASTPTVEMTSFCLSEFLIIVILVVIKGYLPVALI